MGIQRQSVIQREDFQHLITALIGSGYRVVGPTLRDGAIVYGEVSRVSDLPEGWTDRQEAAEYRLQKREDRALFGHNVGPHSWKKFLFPPETRLWTASRNDGGFSVANVHEDPPKLAFLGVRACELNAIFIQDRVFMEGRYVDPIYKTRRENIFLIAVNCAQAGNTCFCASMNAGPRAASGYDLALTEIVRDGRHEFVVDTGSERGAEILARVPHREAGSGDKADADEIVERTTRQMGRTLDTSNIRDLLVNNPDHPRWDDVAKRCLTCANCTLVCPTCFCSTVEDVTDLKGDHAERWRKWDSCFTMDFSYIYGGSVRASNKSRYRQWMTHKLATWADQFGSSGCVGCGRCITWCPAAIDITEEVKAMREEEPSDETY